MKINFKLIIIILIGFSLKAQNIPVGSIDMIEQRSRNEQLLGNSNRLISYTLRPLDLKLVDSIQTTEIESKKLIIKFFPLH